MFKQALYIYWKSLHPRNLKFIKDKYLAAFVFFFVLLPGVDEIMESGIEAFYAFAKFLPIALMKMSNLKYKLNVPKALFLVPMKEKDREKYVRTLLGIKIGGSILLGLLLELAWSVIYGISIVDILATLFIYLSFGIADYLCVEGTFGAGFKIVHGVWTAEGNITYSTCNLLNIVLVGLTLMVWTPMSLILDKSRLWERIITHEMGVTLLIMLILDIIIVIRQYRDMMTSICNYERSIQRETVSDTLETMLKLKY